MKRIHFIAIGIIAIAVALMLSASKDVGTYASFSDAMKSGKVVKVVGELSKDKDLIYDPTVDANLTSFYITDADGQEREVKLLKSKPQDIERSEQIVVTGQMKGEVFIATEVLTKCPSKYKDEELFLQSET